MSEIFLGLMINLIWFGQCWVLKIVHMVLSYLMLRATLGILLAENVDYLTQVNKSYTNSYRALPSGSWKMSVLTAPLRK